MALKQFGSKHGMEMHGGVDIDTPDGRPMLNVYLAQGYSYYFGDDFDIWLAGDPFRQDRVDVNGIVKNKSSIPGQQALAAALLSDIRKFSIVPKDIDSDHPCPV